MVTKGKESALVDDQAKEALNFQLTWTLITFALAITIIGILCLIPYMLFDIILTIMAAMSANRGERYRYPLTFRFFT
jgi:uncharacterized Tic20 family protein